MDWTETDVGEWKRKEISYLKANRDACALCGHPIAIRSGMASWSAPKTMSVMRGLVSVLPPATGAGNAQFTIVPGGAMIVNGR